jgi:hypothetical protein
MPSGTLYAPTRTADFESTKLNANAQHAKATVTAGQSANIDLTVADDHLATGAWLVVVGGTAGDTVLLQVVDISGAFCGVPNTVLKTFVNWAVAPETSQQFEFNYPAKIYAGLTLRVVYTSTGGTNPFVAINYKLHKVLV